MSESTDLRLAPSGRDRAAITVAPKPVGGSGATGTSSNTVHRPVPAVEPISRRLPAPAANDEAADPPAGRLPRLHRGPAGRRSLPDVLSIAAGAEDETTSHPTAAGPEQDTRSVAEHLESPAGTERPQTREKPEPKAGREVLVRAEGTVGPKAPARSEVPEHCVADGGDAECVAIDVAIDVAMVGAVVPARPALPGSALGRTVPSPRGGVEAIGPGLAASAPRRTALARLPQPRSNGAEPVGRRGRGNPTAVAACDEPTSCGPGAAEVRARVGRAADRTADSAGSGTPGRVEGRH
ncbi:MULTISPECIES: hypothetical protein [Actinoalloteichus]|uniref:hypothetical protein n=1 Tax=Actinoalloteichus TaxID=65496 RepID=UPI0012F89229|nr:MULTISPECIES: hypothetical protein [Actinoalloteichus]